jgi:3-oxoacyl-[acyl-carrier protein] reductase
MIAAMKSFDASRAFNLGGKAALVTGGNGGIGLGMARGLAAAGAAVAVVGRDAAKSKRAVSELAALGVPAEAVEADVSQEDAVRAATARVAERFGRVDILVNNAGITRDGLVMRMSEEDWDAVLNTNLKGAFSFIKAFSRAFLKQRSGRIINITSVIGLIGNAGQCNYAASKAALIGLTKSVARELASRGITCNAVAPGFIQTDMTSVLSPEMHAEVLKKIPLNCLGQPEDIAEAALFLASPAARYITGQVLTVDGGMVM